MEPKGGGLVSLADKFRNSYAGLQQVKTSLKSAEGYLSSQEVALNNFSDIITRMKELAVSAADPLKTESDRDILNTEFVALNTEIADAAGDYNGTALFGSTALSVRIGLGSTDKISLTGLELGAKEITTPDISGATTTNAETMLAAATGTTGGNLADLEKDFADIRSQHAVNQGVLQRNSIVVEELASSMLDSESTIRDIDIAEESVILTAAQIRLTAADAMIAQANAMSQNSLRFFNF